MQQEQEVNNEFFFSSYFRIISGWLVFFLYITYFQAYEDMLKCGYPLPNIRTLQKRTEHLKFDPGVFDDVIEMVGAKISNRSDFEKFYTLSLDEVSLKSGSEMIYDIKSDSYQGDATLPGHTGPASKALGKRYAWNNS